MHELSVAADLLELMLRTARENGAATVVSARLRVGAGSCLNTDSLLFGFEALSAETPAAGCRIEIEHVPAPAVCLQCAWSGELPDVSALSCPTCQAYPVRITGGRELTVETITVE
jgi:hydrogenase nickel incorporation protein HypA/HybF